MDHTAAQATFVEIAFGVNTLFAVYRDLRTRLETSLTRRLKEFEATAKSIENHEDDMSRLNRIKEALGEILTEHLNFQNKVFGISTKLSIFAASMCVCILYFDWLDIGKWAGLLLVPFPTYVVIHVVNYGCFVRRGEAKLGRFADLIEEFEEAPHIPKRL
jgi:hypothetical protein